MKRTIGFVALLTAATVGALAQDAKPLPAKTVREAVAAGGISVNSTDGAAQSQAPRTNLFFCPQGECLYYSGDWDCNSSDANALFDFDNPGIGISDAEVWVGIRPRKNATITGTSGNYAAYATGIGTNPTPVAVRSGITPGQGGNWSAALREPRCSSLTATIVRYSMLITILLPSWPRLVTSRREKLTTSI